MALPARFHPGSAMLSDKYSKESKALAGSALSPSNKKDMRFPVHGVCVTGGRNFPAAVPASKHPRSFASIIRGRSSKPNNFQQAHPIR
jgi:hypothetical protein